MKSSSADESETTIIHHEFVTRKEIKRTNLHTKKATKPWHNNT